MAFRILRWMAFLAVLLAAAGGAGAWWIWDRADVLLREQMEIALAEHLPHWNVSFSDFDFDTDGLVRFSDVTLTSTEDDDEFLHVPQIVARVDRDLLLRHERVVVQSVELHQPTIWIRRSGNGDWNWERLAPFPHTDRACPEITIHQGTVVLGMDRTDEMPATEFVFRRVDARFVPAAWKCFHVAARTDVDYAGALVLEGSIDLNTSAWELRGQASSVNTQDGLLEMAAGLSPKLREQMEGLANRKPRGGSMQQLVPGPGGSLVTTVGHEEVGGPEVGAVVSADGPASQFRLPELGLTAEMAVEFSVSHPPGGDAISYSVDADIRDGEIVNDALPLPLFGLQGHISVDDSEIVIEDLHAGNDQSEVSISGRIDRNAEHPARDFTVRVVDLEIGRSVQKYMHIPQLRREFERLSPAGRFNLDVRIQHDGADDWNVTLNEFTALGCSMMHEKFRYPVTDITGSIRQQEGRFVVELDGRLGDRPVAIRGFLTNPGPDIEAELTADVDSFPIDERFIDALQEEQQQPARRAIQNLKLRGLADASARFVKRPGVNEPFWMKLDASVHDASLNFEMFPYALTDLEGRVLYDSLTEKVWYFRDLTARHGETVLNGAASFDLRTSPGNLDLRVTAMQVPLDADLHAACITANPALDQVWREIRPSGMVDAHNISLAWQPGGDGPTVTLPSVQLTGGRFNLASHPYDWQNVVGSFAWRDNRVTIEALEAFHGETFLSIDGREHPDSAYLIVAPTPNVAWNLHLQDVVRLRKLSDGPELRRALPDTLANVFEALQLRGPVDVDLGIDMKASALAPEMVTAHWEMRTLLTGNDLFLGVDVHNAHGQIRIVDGVWDGNAVTVDGYVNLTSVEAFDMPFRRVHGPFTIDGDRLTLGMPEWPEWQPYPPLHGPNNPFAGQQLQIDDLYADDDHEGRLGVNAVVLLGNGDPEQVQYRVDMALRSASLRKWADDQEIRERLDGAVSGALSLRGYGTSARTIEGGGWVHVLPAELYELPLLARIFSEIRFEPPRARGNERPAFNYASGYFTIKDGQFDFYDIRLIGSVINLVGWGQVGFEEANSGQLNLHFLTEYRNRIPGLDFIPILNETGRLLNVLGKHWLHVSVNGTLQHPRARTEANPPAVLTDPIRSVTEALGAGELMQPPRTGPPVPQGLAPRRTVPSGRNPL